MIWHGKLWEEIFYDDWKNSSHLLPSSHNLPSQTWKLCYYLSYHIILHCLEMCTMRWVMMVDGWWDGGWDGKVEREREKYYLISNIPWHLMINYLSHNLPSHLISNLPMYKFKWTIRWETWLMREMRWDGKLGDDMVSWLWELVVEIIRIELICLIYHVISSHILPSHHLVHLWYEWEPIYKEMRDNEMVSCVRERDGRKYDFIYHHLPSLTCNFLSHHSFLFHFDLARSENWAIMNSQSSPTRWWWWMRWLSDQ